MDQIIWLVQVPVLLAFHPFNALWAFAQVYRWGEHMTYRECLQESWNEFHHKHDHRHDGGGCQHTHGVEYTRQW